MSEEKRGQDKRERERQFLDFGTGEVFFFDPTRPIEGEAGEVGRFQGGDTCLFVISPFWQNNAVTPRFAQSLCS